MLDKGDEVGSALAYSPDDACAERSQSTELSDRRRWRSVAVIAAGPLYAGAVGNWLSFGILLALDVAALAVASNSVWVGSALFVSVRLGFWMLEPSMERMRASRSARPQPKRPTVARSITSSLIYAAIVPLAVYRLSRSAPSARECRSIIKPVDGEPAAFSQRHFDCLFIGDVPTDRRLSDFIAQSINQSIDFLSRNFQGFFDTIAFTVRTVLYSLEALFIGTPWPIMILTLVAISAAAAGWRVAAFTAISLGYLALFGFWASAMSTLVLVGAATLISITFGVPLGIWCAKNARVYAFIRPVLDIMQTIPSFVYLIPAIAFFSIGKTPGVLATVIYSSPVMIRLTALGIRQVPSTVKEAALAFGATPLQLLLKVEMPLALPSLMTGMNQTIMMSLSMSVAAALIGAGGLGYDVLFALQNVEPGRGLLAGLAIAVCAMIIDRTIQGSRKPTPGVI